MEKHIFRFHIKWFAFLLWLYNINCRNFDNFNDLNFILRSPKKIALKTFVILARLHWYHFCLIILIFWLLFKPSAFCDNAFYITCQWFILKICQDMTIFFFNSWWNISKRWWNGRNVSWNDWNIWYDLNNECWKSFKVIITSFKEMKYFQYMI